MADKIVLTEININAKGAIEEVARLRKELEAAKSKANEFKGTTEENSAAHIQAQAEYKAVAAELRTNENLLTKLTSAQKQGVGTIKQLEAENAKLRAEQSKLDLTTAEGIKLNNEYNAKINKNTEFIKNNVDQRKKEILNIGNYPGAFGEAGAAIQKVTGVTQILGTAFKVMLGPIGLIIAAFAALKAYFTRTEEGANKLKVIIAVFNTVLQNFLDIVGKVGGAILDAFTKPKETLQNFGKLIKENINNRIEGLMELFPALGKAIKLTFSGQFKEAGKVAGDAMAKATLGVEDLSGKIDAAKQKLSGFIDEQKREIGIAVQLANQQAALDKQIRDAGVENAKAQLTINRLKVQAMQDDKYSRDEQLAFLKEADALVLQQLDRNKDIAQQKYEIKKANNALADSTKEDLAEEAALLAEVYNVEAANYAERRRLQEKMQTYIKELAAKDLKQKQDAAKAAIDTMDYELAMWQLNNKSKLESSEALTEKLLNDEITRLNTEASIQSEILKTQLDNKLITQQAYNLQSATLEQQNLEAIATLRNTYNDQQAQNEAERLAINYENEASLQDQHIFAQLDRESSQLEQMRLQEIEAAKKTGADVTLINKKYAKEQEAVEKAKTEAKIGLAAGFAGNLATILGEESKAGKAAASAATAINTYQAAMAAYASLAAIPVVGVPLGIAAAGAAVATGYQNIKKIWSADAKNGVSNVTDTTTTSGSTGATTTTASWDRLQSVNTDIGAGIVSRNNTSYSQTTTVLVVDDVTRAQNSQNYAAVNAEF